MPSLSTWLCSARVRSVNKKSFNENVHVCTAGSGTDTLAVIPAACDKGTDPGAFSSYSLQGVAFSYPAAWIDQTTEMEQSIAEEYPNYSDYMGVAAWGNPADSAALFAMSMDMKKAGLPNDYTMTESDKESITA
jgi:hypothetical protein